MVPCLVCELNIQDQSHFGVQSCRACSAFFRRAITEERKYKCKYNGKCIIKKGFRKKCRECRLKKCYEAGMRRENIKSEASINKIHASENGTVQSCSHSNSSETTGINSHPRLLMHIDSNIPLQYPTIYKVLKGMQTFLNSQKAMIIAALPEADFDISELKLLKKSELDKIQKSDIPLIYHMLEKYFEPFSLLKQEQQKLLLKCYAMKFSILMKAYHTVTKFPNVNDTRLVTNFQYIIDYTNESHIKNFLSEYKNPGKHHNLTFSLLKHTRTFTNKFILREMMEIEFAALAYIIFLIECEKFSSIENIIIKEKDTIFKEIHTYYLAKFGYEKGGIKFSNLFYLMDECQDFYGKRLDDLNMATIFLDDFYDVWINIEKNK